MKKEECAAEKDTRSDDVIVEVKGYWYESYSYELRSTRKERGKRMLLRFSSHHHSIASHKVQREQLKIAFAFASRDREAGTLLFPSSIWKKKDRLSKR